jgi:hypothetical protein
MMVSHVVLMKPRPNLTAADRAALVDAFERAVTQIDAVRAVRIGKRVVHGAGYEAAAPDAADYIAIVDFDDLAALKAYLDHPAHEELGARFAQLVDASMVYDFEAAAFETLRVGGLFQTE